MPNRVDNIHCTSGSAHRVQNRNPLEPRQVGLFPFRITHPISYVGSVLRPISVVLRCLVSIKISKYSVLRDGFGIFFFEIFKPIDGVFRVKSFYHVYVRQLTNRPRYCLKRLNSVKVPSILLLETKFISSKVSLEGLTEMVLFYTAHQTMV